MRAAAMDAGWEGSGAGMAGSGTRTRIQQAALRRAAAATRRGYS